MPGSYQDNLLPSEFPVVVGPGLCPPETGPPEPATEATADAARTGGTTLQAVDSQIEEQLLAGSLRSAPVAATKTAGRASPRSGLAGLPPKPRDARYNTLDIVRGMACLMLLFYHATFYAEHSWVSGDPATWTLGGLGVNLVGRLWMGVPMFFVVSGYCIAASIDSLRRREHSLANYFYRRFHRIYPPLWAGFLFAIGFTLLVAINPNMSANCLQLPRLNSFSATDWVANFTATASWSPLLFGGRKNYLLPNTWTLCYEEQFYAVTGLLLVFAARRFFLASYGIAALTLVVRHVCRARGIPIYGFFFDGHWLLFAAGILLYERLNYLSGRRAWAAAAAFVGGAVYGLGERVLAADPHDRHVGEYILVACSFAIFLTVIKRWDRQIVAHWSLQPFRWCGNISYSIYLTHFPITVLLGSVLAAVGIRRDAEVLLITIPLCLAVSLPVGWLFYQFVERHFVNAPAK